MRPPSRRDGASGVPILRSLCCLRLLVAVVLMTIAFVAGDSLPAMLTVAAAAVVVGVSTWIEAAATAKRATWRPDVVEALMTVVDLAAVLVALTVLDVGSGDPASLVLVLPLVAAGLRHGTAGALVALAAVACVLMARLAVTWDGSSSDTGAQIGLVVWLALATLPTARLAEMLTSRIATAEAALDSSRRRSRLLEVVTAQSASLVAAPHDERDDRLLSAIEALAGCRIGVDGSTSGVEPDGRAVRPLHRSGSVQPLHLGLSVEPPVVLVIHDQEAPLDTATIEGIELLVALWRRLVGLELRPTPMTTGTTLLDDATTEAWIAERLKRPIAGLTVALVRVEDLDSLRMRFGTRAADALVWEAAERLRHLGPSVVVGRVEADELFVAGASSEVSTAAIDAVVSGCTIHGPSGQVAVRFTRGAVTPPPLPVPSARELLGLVAAELSPVDGVRVGEP